MNTKKLTEAAVLSALFIILSIVAISTGIAYSIYLDIITPIIISLIYLRVGFKYSILSSITSVFIIILAIGDIISGIWLTQGVLLGFSCAIFIPRSSMIFDDVILSSMIGTIIMLLIDIYFSTLTGYSFIEDFEKYSINKDLFEVTLYIVISILAIGTTLMIYFSTLFIGHKLNILNETCEKKLFLIKNLRKYSSYMCCSTKKFYALVIYIIIVEASKKYNINIDFMYLRMVLFSVEIIALCFIIKDSYSMISKYIYLITKSTILLRIISLFLSFQLLYDLKFSVFFMILASMFINMSLDLRTKNIVFLNSIVQ